jgi:hypothetical protein
LVNSPLLGYATIDEAMLVLMVGSKINIFIIILKDPKIRRSLFF